MIWDSIVLGLMGKGSNQDWGLRLTRCSPDRQSMHYFSIMQVRQQEAQGGESGSQGVRLRDRRIENWKLIIGNWKVETEARQHLPYVSESSDV